MSRAVRPENAAAVPCLAEVGPGRNAETLPSTQ
jgi:hypothetical protein